MRAAVAATSPGKVSVSSAPARHSVGTATLAHSGSPSNACSACAWACMNARDAGLVGYASGAVGDPTLRAEDSLAGRTLYRLFFSARSAPVAIDGGSAFERAIGLAGSFDGVHFARAESAVLSGRADPAVRAPSAWSDGPLRTWLFVSGRCDSAGRNEGIRVAVAPGNRRYPRTP